MKNVVTTDFRPKGGRVGTLNANIEDIRNVLGNHNLEGGDGKVDTEWAFTDGKRIAGLWAYRQPGKWCTRWSVGGDISLVEDIFGIENTESN